MSTKGKQTASILDFLSVGIENAITARRLCELLHCRPRDISLSVEHARRSGHPICAACGSCAGYFLPRNKYELQHYCDKLRRRGGEIFKTRRACLKALEKMSDSAFAKGLTDTGGKKK
jgi:hypothetical protein